MGLEIAPQSRKTKPQGLPYQRKPRVFRPWVIHSNDSFDDNAQIKLKEYCSKLNINFMLSNSDPKNIDVNDNFFDDLYSQFKITRLLARRMINSKANNRGSINEIVIRNY